MKIYCAACGRQIVNYAVDSKYAVGSTTEPVKHGWGDQLFCHICSRNLDEHGNFPDEY